MKLHIEIDSSEEGDPAGLSTLSQKAAERNIDALASILSTEFAELYPEVDERAGADAEGEVSVTFMTPQKIREVNKKYRGIDEATDVLSFPLWETDGVFAPEFFMPRFLPLGDVIICPSEAERLCDMAPIDAMCLMFAHGFLHLLAFDHDTQEREKVMWERQDELAKRLLAAINAGESL
ncbi:hypothetical protein FACS1894187_11470 [Synergistales bacterium]|nr:hypothetical protein FACS1894187_11470 [Synergistales bacterium]